MEDAGINTLYRLEWSDWSCAGGSLWCVADDDAGGGLGPGMGGGSALGSSYGQWWSLGARPMLVRRSGGRCCGGFCFLMVAEEIFRLCHLMMMKIRITRVWDFKDNPKLVCRY